MRLLLALAALIAAILAAVFLLRDLPPPERVVFAAGPRDGGYWSIAEQYRDLLARDGIAVEILETEGSVENLQALAGQAADVGLLQGGIPAGDADLQALATVFVEPIIAFGRAGHRIDANPARWRGLTIARGSLRSGTRVAVNGLLDGLGIAPPANQVVDLGGHKAAAAVLAGEVDVAVFVAPMTAPYLGPLFRSGEVVLLELEYPEAISLRLPDSRVVTAPPGAVSLDPVIPRHPLPMVALLARLVAHTELHPALIDRFVVAARRVHGGQGIFASQGQFPTAEAAGLPINPGALKLLAEGQSTFHGWLPYWIAAQIRRVLLVLLPLLFVVVPLVRSLPGVYRWTMRRRIWRHYREIRKVEADLPAAGTSAALSDLSGRLDAIELHLATMQLPPPFREGAYNARLHIDLVRRQIAERRDRVPAAAGSPLPDTPRSV